MQKPEHKELKLSSAPQRAIHRRIAALTVPAVIASVTTPLLGLMDTALTGHMGSGGVYLAAIALGSNAFNLLYWMFGFLRMGTSGMAAQAHGAVGRSGATVVFVRSLAVALCASLLLMLLFYPLSDAYRYFMAPDLEVWASTGRYLSILVAGIPAVLATTVLTGWFIGMQLARQAMWMSIAIDVVNLGVSLILVLGFDLKVEGVAYGTLAAQWTGVVIGAAMIIKRLDFSGFSWREVWAADKIKRFVSVNLHIFLRTLCMIAVTLWFTRVGAMQGTAVLAANAVLLQFFLLFSYFTDGVAYAAEALVGFAVGAGDRRGLNHTLRALSVWGGGIALLFTAVYLIGGDEIISLLTDESSIRDVAHRYLPWAVAIPLAGIVSFIGDGVCIGATRTLAMLLSVAVATAVFFVLIAALLPLMGNDGLWLAFVCYLFFRSIYLIIFIPRMKT